MKKKILIFLFIVYIAVLLRITVFRSTGYDSYKYNFSVFYDLYHVYVSQGAWKFTYLFVGNIIWFVPYGFMLPLLNGKLQFLLVAIYGLFLTILVEFTQFVTKRGVFELDDLILNTVGVIIGYGVYHITIGNKHRGKSK